MKAFMYRLFYSGTYERPFDHCTLYEWRVSVICRLKNHPYKLVYNSTHSPEMCCDNCGDILQ